MHCQECNPRQYPKTDATVQEVFVPGAGKMNLCEDHDPYRTTDMNRSMRDEQGHWYGNEA